MGKLIDVRQGKLQKGKSVDLKVNANMIQSEIQNEF